MDENNIPYASLHNRLKTKYFEKFEFSRTLFLKFFILSSGATTQGNFKRNLQKFKNREDVKVHDKEDVIIKGRQKCFQRLSDST